MHFDRRQFARHLAAGTICSLPLAAGAGLLVAEDNKKQDEKEKEKQPTVAELILELVKRTDPNRLEAEHLTAIRKDIDAFLARSRALSSFPLVNADEPAFVFAAYRSE